MVQQALADQYKDQVKTWVPKLRKVLQDDLADQLDRLGLRRDGRHKPIDKIPPSAQETRKRIHALLCHETRGEDSAERGYDNVLFELTYTLLNRLVGLKCMEARQLLYLPPPSTPDAPPEQTEVITLIPGQERSRYLRDFRTAAGDRYKYEEDAEEALLRDALTAAFRHVTNEIRILFDPDHEYACVWPTHPKLGQVIRMINNDQPDDVYRAADFLGWVYQFFNRDEKKRVRDENKGTPRSSYELAVINQFYTPSWVVKALVDNTLGRLWLQMHPDSSLWPKSPPPLPQERNGEPFAADYLVPRTGEKIRYRRVTETGEVEEFKPVHDITLLDPACGTMHFGQYAFGLFYRMYEEEIENAGKPGWPAQPLVTEPRDIPAAIIENNLFGIDIDPRAIQIASLSLLLTAKEAALRHDLSPQDVRIRRTNLVVANGVDLGEERLRELVGRIFNHQDTKGTKKNAEGGGLVSWCLGGDKALGERLFSTIWDNLQYVGELGSLVRVRESVSRVLEDWADQQAKAKGITRPLAPRQTKQMQLGTIVDDAERHRVKQLVLQRRLLDEEAVHLRDELLAALEVAAGETAIDPTERLFAEDTARGLKLLQILSRQYDVVVMNPPYGSFVPKVKDFVRAAYPLTYNDIYAAFIDRGTQLLWETGYLGALVSRTFVNLTSFEKLRTHVLLKRNPLVTMLDLGFGILDDATVETAAIVTRGGAAA
jgi:hypothetical protein